MHLTRNLSSAAKNVLANLLSKRNSLTLPVLRILAHRDLESVTLQGCLVRDSAVDILNYITRLRILKFPENEISTPGKFTTILCFQSVSIIKPATLLRTDEAFSLPPLPTRA